MSNTVLGIDIGGSHITAGLVNFQAQEILQGSKVRDIVDSKGTVNNIINKWGDIIRKSYGSFNVSLGKIGIAMPPVLLIMNPVSVK